MRAVEPEARCQLDHQRRPGPPGGKKDIRRGDVHFLDSQPLAPVPPRRRWLAGPNHDRTAEEEGIRHHTILVAGATPRYKVGTGLLTKGRDWWPTAPNGTQ